MRTNRASRKPAFIMSKSSEMEPSSKNSASDPIEKPSHYTKYTPEPITVIEGWNLGFHLGNVVKYICRSPHKGNQLQDLRKARWYLDRHIQRMEKCEPKN
jgi:hypothetical protein